MLLRARMLTLQRDQRFPLHPTQIPRSSPARWGSLFCVFQCVSLEGFVWSNDRPLHGIRMPGFQANLHRTSVYLRIQPPTCIAHRDTPTLRYSTQFPGRHMSKAVEGAAHGARLRRRWWCKHMHRHAVRPTWILGAGHVLDLSSF